MAVAAISAAILAYEVLLMRLFSITGWHHFAYMIISVALLGFGASGTALAVLRERLAPYFGTAFVVCCGLFSATVVMSFAIAVRLPFNPLAIVWDASQLGWLAASYALLVIPFFFGASAIGVAFLSFPKEIGRIYGFDLVGAGLGTLGILGLLFALPPTGALRLIVGVGFTAAALALLTSAARRTRALGVAALGAALVSGIWLPSEWIELERHISEFKELPMALLVPDARIIEQRSSPMGLISVVESPTIPFRHAPGLSLNNVHEPPPQLAIFVDGDAMSPITHFNGDLEPHTYLDFTTSALPYHLVDDPSVLVLGAGGGEQVLLAVYHQVPTIDAVEINPQVVELVSNRYADFAGGLYNRAEVEIHVAEPRAFVETTTAQYDVIQIPPVNSFGAGAAGAQSLSESYVFTVEALQTYLRALKPGGMLAVTLWLKLPPRDTTKLLATALYALEGLTIDDPENRIALIRSWSTATLVVKNGALTESEIARLTVFAAERSFDVSYYPGIGPEEVNRYNLLQEPYLYQAALELTGSDRLSFIDGYKFNIEPPTDDRPFFFNAFKWQSASELLNLRAQGTAALLDLGYLILFAILVQAIVLSVALILLPLWIRRRRFGGGAPKAKIMAYFLALGLAFIFVEIAFIQRFVLFLGHPLYALAIVLASFLLFAGLGSSFSSRFEAFVERVWGHYSGWRIGPIQLAAAGIALIAIFYLVALPPLFEALIGLPRPVKIAIALVLIAPLAGLMGLPFPLGIRRVAGESEDLIAWAWGINGCASVISAVLATMLAMHLGFTTVILMAVALYLLAPLALSNPNQRRIDAAA